MKRFFSIVTAMILISVCFAACGRFGAGDDGKLKIVATVFPEYDWVMNVLGDNPANAEATLLLGSGVDLHSFNPSAQDIMNISSCDLFIYVGGESDDWAKAVLEEAVNKDMIVINLMEVLGSSVREEEAVEGMQEEEEHGEKEYDEHVWLSLRNAETIVGSISEALGRLDPENAEVYSENAAEYAGKLRALDAEYAAAVGGANRKTLLFGDRFPFRYLTEDYGLSYFAAFAGCSAETEASFETVAFLVGKVDELGLRCVLTVDGSDHRIAETIVQNTASKDQTILELDSMQSTTAKDAENGATYLSIMEKNLSVLKEALK